MEYSNVKYKRWPMQVQWCELCDDLGSRGTWREDPRTFQKQCRKRVLVADRLLQVTDKLWNLQRKHNNLAILWVWINVMLGLLCQDLRVRGDDVPAGPSTGALLCQYSPTSLCRYSSVCNCPCSHKLTLSSHCVSCSSDSEVIPYSKKNTLSWQKNVATNYSLYYSSQRNQLLSSYGSVAIW